MHVRRHGLALVGAVLALCAAAPAALEARVKKGPAAPPTPAKARSAIVQAAIDLLVVAPEDDALVASATEVVRAAREDRAASAHLAVRLAGIAVDDPAWERVRRRLPSLEPEAVRAWWRAVRPKVRAIGFDHDRMRLTPAVGGGGGAEIRWEGREPLVGLRCTHVDWAGHRIVRSLQPLHRDEARRVEGPTFGVPGGDAVTVVAPEGYALGALFVRGGARVDGFAPVFLRVRGATLDRDDARLGRWEGGRGGAGPGLLGGEGWAILGLHGRSGVDVDALGLVESAPTVTD